MAFNLVAWGSGESGDGEAEGNSNGANGYFYPQVSTAAVSRGTYSVLFDYSVSGGGQIEPNMPSGLAFNTLRVMAFTGLIRVHTTPASGLIAPIISRRSSTSSSTVANGNIYLGIDDTLHLVAYSTGSGSKLYWRSDAVLSTSTFKEVIAIWAAEPGKSNWGLYVFIDGALEGFGLYPFPAVVPWASTDGFAIGGNSPGSTAGAWYGDDMVVEGSTSSDDAPWNVAYPRLRISGEFLTPPVAEGTYNAWNDGTSVSPNTYQAIDDSELPTHDGDTSYVGELTGDLKVSWTHATDLIPGSSPEIPSDATIRGVAFGKYVIRSVDAAKGTGLPFIRFGGTDQNITGLAAGTAYVGMMCTGYMSKPGGGSWDRSDAGLTAGVSKLEYGFRTGTGTDSGRLTLASPPAWFWYNSSLPVVPQFITVEHYRKGQTRRVRGLYSEEHVNFPDFYDLSAPNMNRLQRDRRRRLARGVIEAFFDGVLTFSGTLTTATTFRRALSGVLSFSGDLAAVFTAGATAAGSKLRQKYPRHPKIPRK